jgi:hypothetical protein
MQDSHLSTFNEISQILCRCEQLKGDICSLSGEHVKTYKSVFKGGEFLPRIRTYLFQTFVIQLCMILHCKEHHSLATLIRKLLEDSSLKWADENSKHKMEDALARIETLESVHINTLRTLRDKFWAHRDRQRNNHAVSFTYNTAWLILEEMKQIYNIVNMQILQTETRFDVLSSREPIELAHLARYSKMYERLRPEMLRPADDLSLDLIYLMRGIDRSKFK